MGVLKGWGSLTSYLSQMTCTKFKLLKLIDSMVIILIQNLKNKKGSCDFFFLDQRSCDYY